MKTRMLSIVLIFAIFMAACTRTVAEPKILPAEKTAIQGDTEPAPEPVREQAYAPEINPSDFSPEINNRFFDMPVGKRMTYRAESEDGVETVEVYVTNRTRLVMGVMTRVVWDRAFLDGSLIEETYDWYAQDKEGNVWYFGEETAEFAGGKVVSRSGSWEAGKNGALPGIVMEASPKVGDKYRQEYLEGEAEDMGEVLSLNEAVTVPFGSFAGCLKTKDWTPLDTSADENKIYCRSAGGSVLDISLEDGKREELVKVEYGAPEKAPEEQQDVEPSGVTEADAENIALGAVPGKVTDIAIEMKLGKLNYVVEVQKAGGGEVDVIIDRETGKVLLIES